MPTGSAWSHAVVRFTGRAEGDLRPGGAPSPAVLARRAEVVDLPWAWLRQVHGAGVVVVDDGPLPAGDGGDALVTDRPGVALAVHTADCAPIALASPEGVIAAVHAGWRGLMAGVVEESVGVMRALGANQIAAAVGPCIHAECYEFGSDDLAKVAARLGDGVRARTASGAPALDLPAAVRSALAGVGIGDVVEDRTCTACSTGHFSHRARGDTARQALVVWRRPQESRL